MFNFESIETPDIPKETAEQKDKGLEGVCERCEGEGRIRPGFLKAKKVCGNCHGKGFIHTEASAENKTYSWDTGLKH